MERSEHTIVLKLSHTPRPDYNYRDVVWEVLGNKCVQCGEADRDILQVDHIDPREKRFEIGRLTFAIHESLLRDELKLCQILCCNCHRKKTLRDATISRLPRPRYKIHVEGMEVLGIPDGLPEVEKSCEECSQVFTTGLELKKFCSPRCQKRGEKRRWARRRRVRQRAT